MNTKKIIHLSLIALLCASTAAYAEMVQGMITRIDQSNSLISIRQTGRIAKNTTEQLDVRFRPDTRTKNVDSVQQLAVGQEVKVDIKQNKDQNVIEAKSIEVTATGTEAASRDLQAERDRADQARRDLQQRDMSNAEASAQSAYGSDMTPRGQAPTPVSQGVPSAAESASATGHNAERGALPPGSSSDSGY